MNIDNRVPANKYLDPFTDFGFKKIFGEKANKNLLIDFLNSLLEGKEKIKDLTYKNTEQLGIRAEDRTAIYDLYCENEEGEKFIIELQKNKQDYFRERSVYYATFPIQEQAEKGQWDFDLKAVYLIGILDFIFEEDKDSPAYKQEIKLKNNKTNKVFYDKLTFIYLEMPKFKKEEHELESSFDKWLYVLKSLPYLQTRPKVLEEKIFSKLFDIAKLAKMDEKEHSAYEASLKRYRDNINTMDYAKKEAREKGREEGREEGIEIGEKKGMEKAARNFKNLGLDTAQISQATGLSIEEIKKL